MLHHLTHPRITRLAFILVFIMLFQLYFAGSSCPAAETAPVKPAQTHTSPAMDIISDSPAPNEPGDGEDQKSWIWRNKWWLALGTILVGGAAAAVAGGDSSGSSGSSGSGDGEDNNDTGNYEIGW